MGQKLLAQSPFVDLRRGYYLQDDFEVYTDAKLWTAALTGSSAPTVLSTGQDGVLVQLCTSSTNDASFIFTTIPLFKWANGVVHECEAILQFSEASTNNANVWFGFSSVNTVAMLVNASAGPATSFSGAGIYKQGGTLTWRTVSSQSTTQNLNNTTYAAAQAGYQRLRVQCEVVNSVMEVTYWIDQGGSTGNVGGLQMRNTSSFPAGGAPIKDFITLSSPAAMYLGIGVKNGTGSAETLNVDYIAGWKHRSNFLGSS